MILLVYYSIGLFVFYILLVFFYSPIRPTQAPLSSTPVRDTPPSANEHSPHTPTPLPCRMLPRFLTTAPNASPVTIQSAYSNVILHTPHYKRRPLDILKPPKMLAPLIIWYFLLAPLRNYGSPENANAAYS